ncbi:hypothetical protein HIM_09187 [Hirsutella minnesotensis 3608]|uniref:Uncharacterized protein n=1 Tax=Hirsutella minnesotensis 3608 TaxID=1043627 RepID=A0A0F8A387_9HYPO|nr:hypothetical protein HIM_09187 [Hirsutella minnesotensis 3608]
MPSQMVQELHRCLGDRSFRFCAARSGMGAYEFLVKVDAEEGLDSATVLLPDTLDKEFDLSRSRVWRMPCCKERLQWDGRVWLKSVAEDSGKVVFGDTDLRGELRSDIEQQGQTIPGRTTLQR